MSALPKIAIGALATTAAAWFLHGPLGLGHDCAVDARINGGSAAAAGAYSVLPGDSDVDLGTGSGDDATPEALQACYDQVLRAAGAGTINFATGGAAVADSSAALLDQIAGALRGCTGATVEVAGHTDAQGDAAANQVLSQRRAEAVVAHLVHRGIPRAQLIARGYGEGRPVDPIGPENNPRNRRIEFSVSAAGAITRA